MARFDSARALALRLITRNGRNVTLRKVTDTLDPAGTPNTNPRPWVPEVNQVTEQNITVRAVILNAKRSFIDGSVVKISDKVAYIAVQASTGADVVISKKDVIVDGTREYRIEELELLGPNEQNILYTLMLVG